MICSIQQLASLGAFSFVLLLVVTCVSVKQYKEFQYRATLQKPEGVRRKLYFNKLTGEKHPLFFALKSLIDEEGAGSWPPRTNYKDWPSILQPYHEICLESSHSLSASEGLLDDDFLTIRRVKFRQRMQDLLNAQIDIPAVVSILETDKGKSCPRDVLNAFYCCIAVCRHAYRWAVIPVVKIAQEETEVVFPPELDIPWSYLQKQYGMESDSGNNTSNVLHNFDAEGRRMYRINYGMSRLIASSEENFYRLFHDVEIQVCHMPW